MGVGEAVALYKPREKLAGLASFQSWLHDAVLYSSAPSVGMAIPRGVQFGHEVVDWLEKRLATAV
jgi:hypothetical protein